jgi:hypothetical protein
MVAWRRVGNRLGSGIVFALVPLFAVFVLTLSVQDIGPAWSAKFGNGTHGTFTADRCDRGKSGCFWKGTFVSDTGRTLRTDVGLASGDNVTHVGQQVEALDTGDRVNVYPAGGGWDWLYTMIFFVLSLTTLCIWTLIASIRVLRRLRAAPVRDRRSV